MSRIRFAARILQPLHLKSVLDVGCRDAELSAYLNGTEYHGADLFPGEKVEYVGDISTMTIDGSFDAVVACDVLEHLNDPSAVFDRLLPKAERFMLVSLPNTYDLKSRMNFATKGRINGKYVFIEPPPLDRHHWLMGRDEIYRWCEAKAAKHGVKVKLFDMPYGDGGAVTGKLATALLPRSLSVVTVFALFSR